MIRRTVPAIREAEAEDVGATSRLDLIYSKRLEQSHYNSEKFRIFAAKLQQIMSPVLCVELAKNSGIPEHKLSEIKKIVEKYADSFKQQFRQHIGKRIDD